MQPQAVKNMKLAKPQMKMLLEEQLQPLLDKLIEKLKQEFSDLKDVEGEVKVTLFRYIKNKM